MATNLLIVESPAKAKTIEKILGEEFQVKSCYGHIRDLKKEDMGIDVKNNYQPSYKISDDKEKVVKELKSLAKKSKEVWLATDEDREGEAISWHLCEVLGLDPTTTKRIVFSEITKKAIKRAVDNPRTVNMDLVNAQQARRILDRLVGFEISPILWRKISMRNNLSAGRVQSVAVKLLVERERAIHKFQPVSSFKVEGFFHALDLNKKKITFKADGDKISDTAKAKEYLEQCVGAKYTVKDIQVKPAKKSPAAPFTTSTLQQEASRKLGYSVSKTMLLAQKLYENGHITYMRTDSVNLSDTALEDTKKSIVEKYGEEYHQQRAYKTKNDSAQEAHEAIRPTDMSKTSVTNADQSRLYDLIWKRTMACQMADAQLERTTAKIEVSTNGDLFTAKGEVMKFEGFLKAYAEGKDEEDEEEDSTEGMLPPLTVGQELDLKEMRATERFTRPQARFTEASLVKKLEELGIGRPSTYAPTISTVQNRGYVEKRDKEGTPRDYEVLTLQNDKIEERKETENVGAERNKLFPTDLGMVVVDFLSEHFKKVMDYGFTAKIEGDFDEIAKGQLIWNKMLDGFYTPFHENVEHTLEHAERVKGEHPLGTDPESGRPVIARLGRFGPMVQIGDSEDEEKPRFAKLRQHQSIETITFEEAMELFKLPRKLGLFEGEDVVVNIGRFGPYAQHMGKFYSLKKEMDPYKVELDEVAPLIVEKRKALAEKTIKIFEEEKIKIFKGPYGPYIKQGLRNYKIPKERHETAADITLEEAQAIIEEIKANPPKKSARGKKKKKS